MEDTEFSPEELNRVTRDFVFSASADKYVPFANGRWMLDIRLSKQGMIDYLVSARHHDLDVVKHVFARRSFCTVNDSIVSVSTAPVVEVGGCNYLNLYVPPTIQPAPGPYPRIEAVLDWLTKGDTAGKAWLVNWVACKVQDPTFRPMVAVVLNGSQGSGKGTFYSIVSAMLGQENCASITERSLANKFNARWSNKLFVLADEVMAGEHHKTVSEHIKGLVADNKVEQEKKGQNQTGVKNQIAWVFASNDAAHPVRVEKGDRRFSVFTNFNARTKEYKDLVDSCFDAEGDSSQFREDFTPEVAGFMHACLNMKAERKEAAKVFENDSRGVLMSGGGSPVEAFFDEIESEPGALDLLLEQVANNDPSMRTRDRDSWDFGDTVATDALHRCYLTYCVNTGLKYTLGKPKFAVNMVARGYVSCRVTDPVSKRQVYAYRGPWLRGEKTESENKPGNVISMKGGR